MGKIECAGTGAVKSRDWIKVLLLRESVATDAARTRACGCGGGKHSAVTRVGERAC